VDRIARQIFREGMDMSSLIGRFLDIAAIDSGKIQAEPERFDLASLVRHAALRHAGRAQEKQIELVLAFGESPVEAWADVKFTNQVLDNLISNALKFSPLGTTVTLRCEDHGEEVVATVGDQGPGLTEKDRQNLFGRFSRLSAQPTGGEKTIGLGLSIVKHLVDAMGGQIRVVSEPGRGATFLVGLPAGHRTGAIRNS
jgi:signal transduction histidine kinase